MLYVCTPTYRRFDLLIKMIESGENGSVKPDGYIILDNSAGQLVPYLRAHAPDLLNSDRIEILIAQYNMGVARGWNRLLEYVQQTHGNDAWALVVNDDILFHENTIQRFADEIENTEIEYHGILSTDSGDAFVLQRATYPILCTDMGLNAFSMFACNPKVLFTLLGRFDESIWPAYHEDGDMKRRMDLAGYSLYRIPDCEATHSEGGSATIASYTEDEMNIHHHQFRRNQAYYISKWGGDTGKEIFTQPFNNQDLMHVMQMLYTMYGF